MDDEPLNRASTEKSFKSITRGDLDLGNLDDEETKKAQEESEKEVEGLVERIKTALGDKR